MNQFVGLHISLKYIEPNLEQQRWNKNQQILLIGLFIAVKVLIVHEPPSDAQQLVRPLGSYYCSLLAPTLPFNLDTTC